MNAVPNLHVDSEERSCFIQNSRASPVLGQNIAEEVLALYDMTPHAIGYPIQDYIINWQCRITNHRLVTMTTPH
jgi:hypothetical protein